MLIFARADKHPGTLLEKKSGPIEPQAHPSRAWGSLFDRPRLLPVPIAVEESLAPLRLWFTAEKQDTACHIEFLASQRKPKRRPPVAWFRFDRSCR